MMFTWSSFVVLSFISSAIRGFLPAHLEHKIRSTIKHITGFSSAQFLPCDTLYCMSYVEQMLEENIAKERFSQQW